jgi:hypothetical protein
LALLKPRTDEVFKIGVSRMDSDGGRKTVEGLWKACADVEAAARVRLLGDLSPFQPVVECCYEAGIEVPTLSAIHHDQEDMRFAALFLKRTLTDLRSVWVLLCTGYTSQAASVAAALFEHSLAVNALAGNPSNVQQLKASQHGDLPWSPMQLSRMMAEQMREEAKTNSEPFTDKDFERT